MLNSIAILGRPNVGKSSLFNKLTKSRNAIVSDFSGLTKDRNFGYSSFKGKQYLVVDTGGVGSELTDFSEAITEQALIAAEESNLIILLIDGSQELTSDDINLFEIVRKFNKNFIVVLNKIDIKQRSNAKEDLQERGAGEMLEISAEHSRGIKELQIYLADNLEETPAMEIPGTKIAVIGRPNAGKSTFINQFTKQDRLIVSDIPGTTIDSIHVPFTFNDEEFVFIDTAGIRKRYRQSHAVEYFSYVRAMHAVAESEIVLMLIDANDGVVDQDLRILNLIREHGKPVVIAFNKVDELTPEDIENLLTSKKYHNSALGDLVITQISALQKRGFKKLFDTLADVHATATTKFSTGMLNKLLEKFALATNIPSVGGRPVKMRYIHFGGIYPTKLIIHSNVSSKIPANYRRYLINSFREALNLKSVELNLIFKKGENPYEGKKNELTSRQIKKKKRLVKHVKKNK
ncbi:ribosome biogenesis GTPase Der [Gammaproteobacteria bacterium]|jgi:GTP-binding protein|nr:ribosome biogenesis GTPase Der [Gammaproteobacteria bacterium]MDA9970088.1 ribosome biogenesis GTPase Der [Gammaproteobacteria bacterium]MDA9971569.1 ribosome biogenesis GTPase Der [Gammaproteobacteria bacterium]MDB4056440.1 ribosome biogenesis GTPase Der [Gammaproteobacteria bacterium]MDC1332073.1 ribosome biogenesis GTPase Der [Gammaproteobacteria bacterium]|tara:strand:- start:109 stop:1491 length:1383 start_codon:yes stop_codon:yes gene_type:complete